MIRIIPRQSFPYMIVTMILGTLNHFLYDWSGKNPVIALFTPVNESVWGAHETALLPISIAVFDRIYHPQAGQGSLLRFQTVRCLVRYAFHYHAFLWIQRRHRQVFRAD